MEDLKYNKFPLVPVPHSISSPSGSCLGLSWEVICSAGEAGDCRLAEGSSYYSAWLGTWPHQAASLEQGAPSQGAEKSGLQWGSGHQLRLCGELGGTPLVLIWHSAFLPSHFLQKSQESRSSVLVRKKGQIGMCPF